MAGAKRTLVASFDVFDTLLTRTVGEPRAVALLLGRRLARAGRIDGDAAAFARQRRSAEERAFVLVDGDPPLGRIHEELARALGRPGIAAELAREELALERRLIRPLPGAGKLLTAARSRGERVVFVSDTNLTEAELTDLLESHGLRSANEAVFASCVLGASKARGTLYPRVARALGIHPRRITHHGDNPTADVRNARLSGWRAEHHPGATLNRYERALERHSVATGGLTSAMAGAARLARNGSPASTPRDRALVDVATGVAGPVLCAWTLWVLRRAVEEGLERLYFVSRDGQVLLDVARRLERQLKTGLDLRYLHGSRQAWMLAGLADAGTVEALNDDRDFRSVTSIAAGLGLGPSEIAGLLPPALRTPARWERDLSVSEREEVSRLVSHPEVQGLSAAASTRRHGVLSDFLRQEGFDGASSAGVVDVGWRGRTTRALAGALERAEMPVPGRFFFFGLGDDAHRVVGDGLVSRLDAYYYDRAAGHGFVDHPPNLTACIEMFCAADHGTVTGYEAHDRGVRATQAAPPAAVIEWGLPLVRASISAFADTLLLDDELLDRTADARPALRDVLELFWDHPTPEEVAAWGEFPTDVDQAHSRTVPIARPVRLADVVQTARAGRLQLRPTFSWPVGTARASGPLARGLLEARWRLGRELPRARRRSAWLRDQAQLLRSRG